MSLLTMLRKWFSNDAQEPPAERDGGVAVLEPPNRRPSPRASAEPAPADSQDGVWWRPAAAPGQAVVAGESEIDGELYEALNRVLGDPQLELPPLPEVAQRVLTMLRGEDADLRGAAEVAARDPVLAAEILRVANSVAYRGVRDINRLDHAFTRLGQKTLRGLLLTATVRDVAIRIGGGATRSLGEELWRSSWASAILMGEAGKRCGKPEDDMFLAGLLHDIGKLAVLRVVHDHHKLARSRVSRPVFDELCVRWHEAIGLRIADAWNLPDPLPELIGSHHREPGADDPLRIERSLLLFVDAAVALLGFAAHPPQDLLALPASARLGLIDDARTIDWLRSLPQLLRDQMES